MKVGPVLIIIGMIIMAVSALVPMATLTYAEILSSFPSGTITEPCLISCGQSMFTIIVIRGEVTDVKAKIKGVGFDYSFELPMRSRYDPDIDIYIWESIEAWTVPETELGVTYTCQFFIEGNQGPLAYMEVAEISGYFTINGQRTDEETHLVVTSPDLEIEYVDTSSKEGAIKMVKVKITKTKSEERQLTKINERTWSVTYTLPEYGTYTIEGYVTSGIEFFRAMSILTVWGDSGDEVGDGDFWKVPQINKLTWVGMGLVLVGFVTSFIQGRKRP